MNRILCFITALIWSLIAYWFYAVYALSGAIEALGNTLISRLLRIDPAIAEKAREQVYGREFSWYAFGSLVSLAIAIGCAVAGSKKEKRPNQAHTANAAKAAWLS